MKRKKKNADAGMLYKQTGMSQQALAQYIGAKQSTLSHHLAGIRLLPNEPGLKLMNMIVQLSSLPQQLVVQTLSAEEKGALQQAAHWCRIQCIPLQKALAKMQHEAAQATRLLQFVAALEKEETDISETKKRWYDNQRYTAQSKLEKNSRYRKIKIETKIAALQKKAEVYEMHLKQV